MGAAIGFGRCCWNWPWDWVRPAVLAETSSSVAVAGDVGARHGSELGDVHVQFFSHATLVSLIIVATFIDFDEQTIPDAITVTGTVAALFFAAACPLACFAHCLRVGAWGPVVVPPPRADLLDDRRAAVGERAWRGVVLAPARLQGPGGLLASD